MEKWWYRNSILIPIRHITGRIFLPVICYFLLAPVQGQINLVPNAGFELKTACPDNLNNLGFSALSDWYPHLAEQSLQYGTPDYFHICSPVINNMGAPLNFFGYQIPRTDSGYIGLGCKNPVYFHAREFIRVQLSEPLNAGQGYCIGLYWSRAENLDFATTGLGLVVSSDSFSIDYEQSGAFDVAPVLSGSQLMDDTISWNLLDGHFVANGGEKWLTIGWFSDYAAVNLTQITHRNDDGGYLFIDDVYLYECDQYGKPENEIIVPDVFTPNGDGINDTLLIDSFLPANTKFYVYSRWWDLVYFSEHYKNDWDGSTLSGSPCTEGTYFYVLQLPQGTTKRGTVNIFR